MKTKPPKKSAAAAPPDSKSAPATATTEGERAEKEFALALRFRPGADIRTETFRLSDRRLYPETKRWTYVLRNRERLGDAGRKETASVELDRLAGLFVPESNPKATKADLDALLREIAGAGLVEVVLPWVDDKEETGYAARLFPWEMVLSFLTRPHRETGQNLTVVRQLAIVGTQAAGEPPAGKPSSLLAVCNAPGKIAEAFKLIRMPAGRERPGLARLRRRRGDRGESRRRDADEANPRRQTGGDPPHRRRSHVVALPTTAGPDRAPWPLQRLPRQHR